ncbi:MAG: cupin domain-containing protein [Verrucomicrobiota bacterium]
MKSHSPIEIRLFADDGGTPNHPLLPLVILRGTEAVGSQDAAVWFEQRFVTHGWLAIWRWTVYPYHHYHSTNHEVLGVSRGTARLIFGGENGGEFQVSTGDVIIIPAGVGHMRLDSSDDFQVVGAYPRGEEPDLIRSGDDESDAARLRVAEVTLPDQDPVFGENGPLIALWKQAIQPNTTTSANPPHAP